MTPAQMDEELRAAWPSVAWPPSAIPAGVSYIKTQADVVGVRIAVYRHLTPSQRWAVQISEAQTGVILDYAEGPDIQRVRVSIRTSVRRRRERLDEIAREAL